MKEPPSLLCKKVKVIDYNPCIICQENNRKYKSVIPKDTSYFEKLKDCMRYKHLHGDSKFYETLKVLECKTYEDFMTIGAFWHTQCYKYATHQTNINSLIARFNRLKKHQIFHYFQSLNREDHQNIHHYTHNMVQELIEYQTTTKTYEYFTKKTMEPSYARHLQ